MYDSIRYSAADSLIVFVSVPGITHVCLPIAGRSTCRPACEPVDRFDGRPDSRPVVRPAAVHSFGCLSELTIVLVCVAVRVAVYVAMPAHVCVSVHVGA